MASLVALPAVAAGTALAIVVPLFALKEALEKRAKMNVKKHLGRRHVCKVHFGELDEPFTGGTKTSKGGPKQGSPTSDVGSNKSCPPAYNELFAQPPPPYGRK